MLHAQNPFFAELRDWLDSVTVIETHEHYCGICDLNPDLDILAFLTWNGYYQSDLASASQEFSGAVGRPGLFPLCPLSEFLVDQSNGFEKRYRVWRTYHDRTAHTAYARSQIEGLRICWGLEGITPTDLLELQERMRAERDQAFLERTWREQGIRLMLANVGLADVMAGKTPYAPTLCRFVFDLPEYHALFTEADIRKPHLEAALGRKIVTLDDYLESFSRFLDAAVDFGIVAMKDQTAYRRAIDYTNPPRSAAENVFNRIVANPRETFGTEQVRALDDYLFHRFMEMAASRHLPVQIHTGHMAGIRNDIVKTNPALMTAVMELHQDVVFDLFHGGWPFLGEFLFLGKNYPNVTLDMCWANAVDPLYSIEFFKRAVLTVPHAKVHGFGGDAGFMESQVGYLALARDNIAVALSELIQSGWLDTEQAKAVATAWLFDNPNRVFRLGLDAA